MNSEKQFFLFITLAPNNIFFNFNSLISSTTKTSEREKTFYLRPLVIHSCGLYKEKGIKRTTMVAFENNFKVFLQRIRAKKLFFTSLPIILNSGLVKLRRNKLKLFFSFKKYLQIILKCFNSEHIHLKLLNNQKFSFNGCRLAKVQRKKIRRKNLLWIDFAN